MAIYVGFFDAAFVEELGGYDRVYDSGDFVEYFGQFIGSGVCLYNNENSMLVNVDSSAKRVLINPGYLFINGYWLKSTELYAMSTAGWAAGTYAIMATLSMGNRSIVLGYANKVEPEVYPDSLVLAYVTIGAGGTMSVVDTRSNTDICGTIDSAGSLSNKVEMALQYIDTEVDGKLDQALATMSATEANLNSMLANVDTELNGKLEEANGMIAAIAPPAVGTIKFSASQDIEEGWLRCDGSYITEAQYPELVAALGKLAPSNDQFVVLSKGVIGGNISNCAVYAGKVWVYSQSERKLYAVDMDGGEVESVALTDDYSVNFRAPDNLTPICLTIIPHKVGTGAKLFLAQVLSEGDLTSENEYGYLSKFLLLSATLAGTGEVPATDAFVPPFTNVSRFTTTGSYSSTYYASADITGRYLPYVASEMIEGIEHYYCTPGPCRGGSGASTARTDYYVMRWDSNGVCAVVNQRVFDTRQQLSQITGSGASGWYQRTAIRERFGCESVGIGVYVTYNSNNRYYYVSGARAESLPKGTYTGGTYNTPYIDYNQTLASAFGPCPMASPDAVVYLESLEKFFISHNAGNNVNVAVPLVYPSGARLFVDAAQYLSNKDIFMVFVGTGLVFFRDLDDADGNGIGYFDTTNVLGTITQFGSMENVVSANALVIVGVDTTGQTVVAKMELNTLYDYATDGTWLPSVASDGVPAFIKAFDATPPGPSNQVTFAGLYTSTRQTGEVVLVPLASLFKVTLNGNSVVSSIAPITFANPIVLQLEALADYTNDVVNSAGVPVTLSYCITLGTGRYTDDSRQGDASYVNWEANPVLAKTILKGNSIHEGETVSVEVDLTEYAKRVYTDCWNANRDKLGTGPVPLWLRYDVTVT